MRISRIGLAVHELGRAREIIGIVVKYGLSEWVTTSGLGKLLISKKRLARIERLNQWERIRLAIEELGPTFIKFGQILAERGRCNSAEHNHTQQKDDLFHDSSREASYEVLKRYRCPTLAS